MLKEKKMKKEVSILIDDSMEIENNWLALTPGSIVEVDGKKGKVLGYYQSSQNVLHEDGSNLTYPIEYMKKNGKVLSLYVAPKTGSAY